MPTKSTKMKLKIRWRLLCTSSSPPPSTVPRSQLFNTDWCLLIEWKLRMAMRHTAPTKGPGVLGGIVGIHGCQLSKRHKIWLFSLPPSLSLYLPSSFSLCRSVIFPVKQSQPPYCASFPFFFHTHTTITIKVACFPCCPFSLLPIFLLISGVCLVYAFPYSTLFALFYVFSVCCRATLNSLLACTNMSAEPPFLFAIKKHVCLPLWQQQWRNMFEICF